MKFGNALLADFARRQPNGKIDAIGIFTRFNAWGYPCIRNWTLILTIYDIPISGANVHIGIKRKNLNNIETLAAFDIKGSNSNNSHTIPIALSYVFTKSGTYEIICSVRDLKSKLKVPVYIETIPWPKFTPQEVEIVRKNRRLIPYKLSAQINCNSCSHAYLFEESILIEEEPQGGTYRFPKSGVFECTNCGYEMNLKDIQGQLRASLKDNVSLLTKRFPNV